MKKFTYYLSLILVLFSSCEKSIPVESVTLNTTHLEVYIGDIVQLNATISPFNATNQNLIWTSSNASVAAVTEGVVQAIKAGTATIIAQSDDGGKSASCEVVVTNKNDNPSTDEDSNNGSNSPDNGGNDPGNDGNSGDDDSSQPAEYDPNLNPEGKIPSSDDEGVFLGGSVLWAKYNLGAENEKDKGGRYGWGDVTGSYYSLDLSHYPSNTPPKSIEGSQYDIVSKKWGNGWRMPTKQEFEELLDIKNCHIIEEDGMWKLVNTLTFKSIYLPKNKIRVHKEDNNVLAYWTSSLSSKDDKMAYCFYPGRVDSEYALGELQRSYGLSIRPVKDIKYKYDPTKLTYSIDGQEFKMIYVEGDEHVNSFYIMQTELPASSYLQIGDILLGALDVDDDAVVTKNELVSFINVLNQKTQIHFRIPSKEEWLYAAKGGKQSKNYKYCGSDSIDEVAWYSENSSNKAQKIATKKPNELGIYDMSGNYEEITVDTSDQQNADGDTYGGSWKDKASNCTNTSWRKGISSGADADRITNKQGIRVSNKNCFDSRVITIRLVYSLY